MFSSKRLIILALAFRHLICFELTFVCDVRYGSTFFLLHVEVQLPQHHLLKRLFFPHCTILAPLQKSVEHRVYGFLSDSQFYFIDLHVCPYANNHYLDYCSFVVSSEIKSVTFSTLFFSKIVLASLVPLHFFMDIFMSWIVSCPLFSFLPNSCVGALTPDVTIFGDRAFKEVIKIRWGHKDGALIQGALLVAKW